MAAVSAQVKKEQRGEKLKALFLDRDDTIIKNIPYMSKVEDIEYLPGVFDKLKKIQDRGYKIFIVTNQSGLSRGLIKYSELEAIHQKISDDFSQRGPPHLQILHQPLHSQTPT